MKKINLDFFNLSYFYLNYKLNENYHILTWNTFHVTTFNGLYFLQPIINKYYEKN